MLALLAATITFVSTPTFANDSRAAVQVDEPKTPAAKPQSLSLAKRRALLIGVGQASFRGIVQNPLPQCVIDAKTLAATLRPRSYTCDVIADGEKAEPTAKTIREQISAASAAASSVDTLLIYISTHGDVIDGKSIIIAQDDAVEIDWIKKQLASSKAAVKILMLDCCRNNKGFERSSTEVRDVHCIMACRPDQLSQVGQSGMSVFTEALVDALVECHADRVKDGHIELDELMYYLERQVPARAAALDKDKPQNPTRTVVDPKAVTPIFADCTLIDQLSFGPDAYSDSPPAEFRRSLSLADLTFLQVQRGMNLEQVTKAIGGTWTSVPELDAKGIGMGLLEGKPSDDDALVVRFEDSKVVLAHVLYTNICKERYDSLRIRAAIEKLVGKSAGDSPKSPPPKDANQTAGFAPGSLAALESHLKGLSPAGIMSKLGCADTALLPTGQFSDQIGELRYPNAPRPGQVLLIRIKSGTFESITVTTSE